MGGFAAAPVAGRCPALPFLRGRFAPRTPRPYLSTAKDRGESSPRGHPPWQSPWGTLLLLGKRSRSARPCPTRARPHQARNCPSRRRPPKDVLYRGSSLTTHKTSRGIPGFSFPPAGSPACGYHPYSSKYGADTCPTFPRPNLIKLGSNHRRTFFIAVFY